MRHLIRASIFFNRRVATASTLHSLPQNHFSTSTPTAMPNPFSSDQRGRGFGPQGRGFRGRGRGRGRGNRGGRNGFATVPAFREVAPGAGVSIVLKVDQPTGREVQGIVADVLTSGDHPRGIKVRLQDGRVGRVQRMVDVAVDREASEGMNNLGRNGESNGSGAEAEMITYRPIFTPGRRRNFSVDIREDGYGYDSYSSARPAPSLADYIRGRGIDDESEREDSLLPQTEQGISFGATVVCPVCRFFEGDEAAVAHHANSHFDFD